jgi:DNA-directed RNA polymerase sigma subunit (sigma70/sigma32)
MLGNLTALLREPVSLDAPLRDDREEGEGDTLAAVILDESQDDPETAVVADDLAAVLRQTLVRELPWRRSLLLWLRYGFEADPLPLRQLGALYSVEEETIRKHQAAAREALREALGPALEPVAAAGQGSE